MYANRPKVWLAGILVLGLAIARADYPKSSSSSSWQHDAPQVRTYHGVIREDAPDLQKVTLDDELITRDRTALTGDEICGYTLYKTDSELPFKIELRNRTTGAADIVLEAGFRLDYERQHKYSFDIAAHDCITATHAQRERVIIEVEDVNDHAPQWMGQDTYMVDVVEGKLYTNILQLEVADGDGSAPNAAICHFHILTPGVPFSIDQQGVLSNTEPLDYSRQHNFILEVKAEDCGGPESRSSDKLLINIRVVQVCTPGWEGFSERIEFQPGSTHQPIAPSARLRLCGGEDSCQPRDVSARLVLNTDHIGKGCDRDTYSIHSQRAMCGASGSAVDLLPSPAQLGAWTKGLPTDDGSEADQVFSFDGKSNAIEVPSGKVNHTLAPQFTISTWMKHEENAEDPREKGTKEHILCNSDGEKMNRHHWSLFVHNCRLVLLLRQEPDNTVDLNQFRPAEWRFKLPEVCDGAWHHYAVTVDFPAVRLYVDGRQTAEQKHNPDIIDDWPLHPSRKVHSTKLVVGACWMGGNRELSQHFRGYLAGLSLVNGAAESDRVIACLNNCKEKLDFHAMNQLQAGMSMEFNSDMTDFRINGHNVTNIERLVRQVGYVNSRLYPTPGHRSLTLHTDITCQDDSKVTIPDVESLVMVQPAEEPIITISGPQQLEHPEMDFPHGVKIFTNIEISAENRKEAEEKKLPLWASKLDQAAAEQDTLSDKGEEAGYRGYDFFEDNKYKLDSCMVKVEPPLNLDVEQLDYPSNAVAMVMIEASVNEDGLVLTGSEHVSKYREILQHVHYINSAPQDVNHRTFRLTCSELNGRFVSNTLAVQVSVIHVSHAAPAAPIPAGVASHYAPPAAHAQADKLAVPQLKNYQQDAGVNGLGYKADNYLSQVAPHTGAGVGMIVIIVVCVGFLAFMIVLGVVRIRAAHHRSQHAANVNVEAERQEMEWDNSALTITVNPMDQENIFEEEHELNGLRDDDDDSSDDDDDGSSFHDDIEESSEEEVEKVKDRRELEWDDSTLAFA